MREPKRFHFIGIGGAGMSGIARVLLEMGHRVTGSDIKESRNTIGLKKQGAKVTIGHHRDNVENVDVVVVSSAIPHLNCELQAAQERGVPILPRAAMLAHLAKGKTAIAVAGTHGKTTTTSMTSLLLEANMMGPTFLIGGELNDIGSNAKYGKGKYFIAETDESDGSLLYLNPHIIVLTNVEADHLDYYGSLQNVEAMFLKFVSRLPQNGYAIICGDFSNTLGIVSRANKKCLTYGIRKRNDFQAKNIKLEPFGSHFEVYQREGKIGEISLRIPGIHNIYNALATIALGSSIGIEFGRIASVLKEFKGVQRRFELIGFVSDVAVIDDYAHHPTEIKVTLQATRNGKWKRVICVFQPHRFSRTKFLEKEFGGAFEDAHLVVMTDVYPAGEEPVPGVSGKLLVDAILQSNPGKQVVYLPKKSDITSFLSYIVEPGDLILTVGAGDIWTVGREFLSSFQESVSKTGQNWFSPLFAGGR